MVNATVGMRFRSRLKRAAALVIVCAAFLTPMAPAQAHNGAINEGISGATAWGPCDWYKSNNVRYTNGHDFRVKAKLYSTGKLGVKMASIKVNSGKWSPHRYFPPLNQWKSLSYFKYKNQPFRLAFTCQDERDGWERPTTDFSGTLHY